MAFGRQDLPIPAEIGSDLLKHFTVSDIVQEFPVGRCVLHLSAAVTPSLQNRAGLMRCFQRRIESGADVHNHRPDIADSPFLHLFTQVGNLGGFAENPVIQIKELAGRDAGCARKKPVEPRRQCLFLFRELVDNRQELLLRDLQGDFGHGLPQGAAEGGRSGVCGIFPAFTQGFHLRIPVTPQHAVQNRLVVQPFPLENRVLVPPLKDRGIQRRE